MVRYAQKQKRRDLFINVTTVLHSSGIVRDCRGPIAAGEIIE